MKTFFLFSTICILMVTSQVRAAGLLAQNNLSDSVKNKYHAGSKSWLNKASRSYTRQGKFYLQAGFNWSWYGQSDINFRGPGYDFTLHDVKGHDQPYKTSLQYNIHAGYHIKDNYSISLGFDHMKYVLQVPQQVRISGNIEPQVSNPAIQTGQYAGNYNNETISVTPEMLTLEYTDGFNYVNAHVQRFDDIWVSRNSNTSLSLETGVGAGLLLPRADVKFFGVGENNKLNVAGWVASAKAGLLFNFNKTVYFSGSLEAGYADMNHVLTTGRNDIDRASHKINFLQSSYLIGLPF